MGGIWEETGGRRGKTGRGRGNGVNQGGNGGTKGGPEWGLSCQEGFELLGGVLGVQNGVMGGE